MKKNLAVAILVLVTSSLSYASDIIRAECVSATSSGKILKLSFCQDNTNRLAACPNEAESFVTVKRETGTLKGTMVESLQLPTDYFYLTREEELTRLDFASDIGELSLNYVGGEDSGGTWSVKIANFDHKFRAVNCTFQ